MSEDQTWVVITTINEPTQGIAAVAKLARKRGWRVIVVGDTKSPAGWECPGTTFISYQEQLNRFGQLAHLIPAQHYSRKNLGYLYAMQEGATCIIETDDDNIPFESFGENLTPEVSGHELAGGDWLNVYLHFSDANVWPRGLPLDAIHDGGKRNGTLDRAHCPIQQFLADGDPDVDAVWRLVFKDPVLFRRTESPKIIQIGTYVPFNSQNTVFFRDAFPLLYLPCHVSFRMTDIWRSFVAQRILWARGKKLCFHGPTVEQIRNEHNLMHDFRAEIDGYLKNREIVACLSSLPLEQIGDIASQVTASWSALERIGVVPREENQVITAWLRANGF